MTMSRKEFLQKVSLGSLSTLVFGVPGMNGPARSQEKDLIKVPFGSTHTGSIKMMTDTVRRHRIDEKYGMLWEPVNLQINTLADAIILKSKPAGCLGSPVIALARGQGHNLQMFEALTINHSSLLVRLDSPYRLITDLKGKKIAAVTRTSGTYQSFYTVARMMGLDPENDCEVIFTAPEAGRRFLETGEVEAFNIYEPFPTNMIASGKTRELVRVRDEWKKLVGKDMLLLGVVAYQEWIAANRELAKKIALVTREAVDLMRRSPHQTIADNRVSQGLESDEAVKLAETRLIELYTPTALNKDLIDSAYIEMQKGAEFGLLKATPTRDMWVVLS